MATAPKKKSSSKINIGGALTRKFGPLPAWAYLLVGAGLIYWWRHRSSSTGASATTTDTSGDTGGFGGSFTPTGDNGGGGGGSSDGSSPTPTPTGLDTPTGPPIVPISTNDGGGTNNSPPPPAGQPSLTPYSSTGSQARAGEGTGGALNTPVPTAAKAAAPAAAPAFGGVKSTVVKNGTTITTYNNGRVVEQAKGKSAYVAKK